MVVDFEHHYIPVELARRMGINTETGTIVEEDGFAKANVHAQLFNLDAQIQDMNRAGIDVAVQTCILGWDATLENCRLLNDCAVKIQKEYRERFVGLAHIPPLEGEPALKELERAVGDLGLKGVTISSQVRGLSLDAEEFRPFYDVVTRLQIPIFVHPALAPKGYDFVERLSTLSHSHARIRSRRGGDAAYCRRRVGTLSRTIVRDLSFWRRIGRL